MTNNKFLSLNHISKSFGNVEVLKDINLEVEEKKFIVLLGPSGCGKTTLLRIISGLTPINSGEIILEDEDLSKKRINERQIGFVFQNYALFPHMSVFDNVAFGLKLRKFTKTEIEQKVKRIIELVELSGLEKRNVKELSGGQQQRVALARALVIEPKLLLLDEPLSNLDAKLRSSVRVSIVQLQKKLGVTAIMVTHDQIEAMTMGDKVILMHNGKIEQEDSPNEIYNNPKTKFVAEFLGSPKINMIPVIFDSSTVILGDVVAPVDSIKGNLTNLNTPLSSLSGMYHFGARPEHIVLSDDDEGFDAEINFIENGGANIILHVFLFGLEVIMCVQSVNFNYKVGDRVKVKFLKNVLMLFDEEGNRI
ncbi:MAG: ABC transporter ATP-binding protein [Sphaerochaetaceae bacterium]|nr:ABC transporter ATP-binding protein [Sphaerochaetaceae bacterium]